MTIKKRKGFKLIKQFPDSEPVVSMLNYKDRILVATSKQIYELKDGDILEQIKIKYEEDNDN